ncbi:MAG: hypothetical protein ACO3YP_15220, partial [bacterium]
MKKLKLKITFVLLLGMFLSACGGGGGGGGSDSNSEAAVDTSTPQGYFAARVSENIIQNKCIICHVSGGLAEQTPLIYIPKSNSVHAEANFNTLQNYIQNEPSRAASMLQKVSGEISHGAGTIQLTKNSIEYGYLKSFLEMVGGNTNISSKPVDDSSSGDDQANSGDQNQITDPVAYFASDISPEIIQGKCIVCHVNGGLAAA